MPGAKFSTKMSAFAINARSISAPVAERRSSVTLRLLAFKSRKYQESTSGASVEAYRPCSPRTGGSTLMTSAPSQASVSVQEVPASNWVRSITRTPARAPESSVSRV